MCRIEVARLDPGQPPRILVGADNWHLSLLTPGGKELRHTYYYAHETSCLRTADLDGDGRREIINCTSFADGNVFDHQARKSTRISTRLGPGADAAAGDLDGDGKKEIVLAGQSGIAAAGRDGKMLWRFDTNCPQTCVRAVDLDGDGKAEVVTAGKNGFIVALDRAGKRLWFRNAGDSINDLAIAEIDGRRIMLAACDDGTVQAWSLAGECVARYGVAAPALRVWVTDLDGDGRPELLAGTGDGALRAIEPR